MITKQTKLFRTVCFLVMMQHEEGLMAKAPGYIEEKMRTTETPLAAWRSLDSEGQLKVKEWARHWGFPLKDVLDQILPEGDQA